MRSYTGYGLYRGIIRDPKSVQLRPYFSRIYFITRVYYMEMKTVNVYLHIC